ncbi:nose resistant to fluoxetine protein 6-like [Anopheles nili]|uniref:nose resistant to fluoxetine protein 6-like n=1 Tax=Anopheles nili TaxID=185578 RepID=UPI00237A8065|nr:nose resistant to fluoxetine protein 6-like [Anopheles nili]
MEAKGDLYHGKSVGALRAEMVNRTEAFRLPPIFLYDNFRHCELQSSVYCYARTLLREDQFPADFVLPHVEFVIPNELFPTIADDKRRYETLVNVCVNQRLSTQYNLTGYTALEYCRPRPEDLNRAFDTLELLFLAVSVTLVSVLFLSTVFDLCGFRRDNAIVSAFSIGRNWARLTADADSALHQDLLYIDGLRVMMNHLVIMLHSILLLCIAPLQNYHYVEQMLSHSPMLVYNSTSVFLVQVFFTIGGYLLSVNVLRDATRGRIDARYVGNRLLNRLLRLLPVYGYFLLFSVSLNVRFDVNVGGFRLFTAENAICRQNWWANLFFVNNFMWPRELCLVHTWYLAADFQLYLMALGLLLVVNRWPKHVGVVFFSAVVASFAIPAYITHQHKLHPVLPIKLSEAKFVGMYEPWIRRIYFPSYANTGCYLFGVIAGYLYHQVQTNYLQLHRHLLYRIIDKSVTPVLLALSVSSCMWYLYDIPKPAFWVSLYSALYRNIIGIFVAVCFLRCINTSPGIFRTLLSAKPLTMLGKLTYCVYVLHDVAMRFVLMNEQADAVIGLGIFVRYMYFMNVVAFAGGLVVFLTIDQPMMQLFKPAINRLWPVGVKSKHH